MRQFILKIIKIALIFLAVLLACLLIIGIALYIDWPFWVGLFVCIGLFGLFLGIILIRKLWVRHREQHFVEQVIEQDDFRLKSLEKTERERSKELQNRWKEAMETLRRSHLRRHGNPLYVLPWYLVFGESGAGKTTAIKSARLSSPFAEFTRTEGISGTRNCDWWFFEHAIIIDTAGRYAIPVDEGRDKEEWQQFLSLLAKFRKREPLNGLVVTVSADKLLSSESEAMTEEGRSIRRRIDQLMAVLGAKFPVYLLVTKCDLIQGMTQFCDHLPEKAHDQAMGFMNREHTSDALVFLEQATATVEERLKELRLQLLHKSDSRSIGRDRHQKIDQGGLLIFPEEFSRLKPNLKAFILGAFQENPFQETPILRALFYSSGRQDGTPYSNFLRDLGLIEEREVLPGTNRGLFLHDFFSRILPTDRRLFAPTRRALQWNRLTRNLGLASWVFMVIALCGLLSFSFVKNLKALNEVRRSAKPPIFQGDILADIDLTDRFGQAVLRLEDENRSWWIPRFGLHESKNVEMQLKRRYCEQFNERFLQPFDGQMEDTIASFSVATDELVFAQYIDHITRRINLLNERLKGADLELLEGLPQPSYAPVMAMMNQDPLPELEGTLGSLYLYDWSWQPDSNELNKEMNRLQTWLKHLLTTKRRNLHWLTTWVNANSASLELTLGDFWGGELSSSTPAGAADQVSIQPAYTIKGKERIDAFIKEIEIALPEPLIIASQKMEFQSWYQEAYLEAWYDFGTSFPKGIDIFTSEEEHLLLAKRMPTDEGPYFLFLDRMVEELEPFSALSDLPRWVRWLYDFRVTKLYAVEVGGLGETGILDSVAQEGKKLMRKLDKKGRTSGIQRSSQSTVTSARLFRDYLDALNEIVLASAPKEVAFRMTTRVFSESHTNSESPFFLARNAADKFIASLGIIKSEESMLPMLLTGPLDYLWGFSCQEAACYLQDMWEEEVLWEVKGMSNMREMNRLLLGQDGYALKFIEGPAAPFISRDLRKGLIPRYVLQKRIPFTDSFLDYFSRGVRPLETPKSSYSVSIKALPTNANREAKIRPHATRLLLECANETFRLVNFQFPVGKTFVWSPETCGDVVFEIEISDTILRKEYTGEYAFAEFLKDFGDGKRTFRPKEFPNEEAALRRFGISEITVAYQFQGQEPVLKLIDEEAAGKIPVEIVKCWDR